MRKKPTKRYQPYCIDCKVRLTSGNSEFLWSRRCKICVKAPCVKVERRG